jgi:hypothetical protein
VLLEGVEVARHGPGRYRVNRCGEPPPGGWDPPAEAPIMGRKPVTSGVAVRAAAPATRPASCSPPAGRPLPPDG